ncbi:MAG: TetR/AcrR family transcriptional regulator [Bacteroidales bacterium]|jgi:AcrR family transcriptional regulator
MNEELKELLEQAAELYYKYGIRSVTMDDIARKMGMSKKTLYQYVVNKEDLVQKVADHVVDCAGEFLTDLKKQQLSALDEMVYVHQFVISGIKEENPNVEFDLQKYYPKLYKHVVSVRRERMYDFLVQNMEKGMKEKVYRDDLDTDIVARLFIARVDTFMHNDMFSFEEVISEQFFNQVFSYHTHALCNSKGLAYYEQKIKDNNEKD